MQYPSLREEILDKSGLLTEELLEEGWFKKAAIIALTIALLAGVAIKGPAVARDVKNYSTYQTMSVADKYMDVDNTVNNEIRNKLYTTVDKNGLVIDYKNAEYLNKVVSNFIQENNQAIIKLNVDLDSIPQTPEKSGTDAYQYQIDMHVKNASNEILSSLNTYVNKLNSFSNKLENVLSKKTAIDKTNKNTLKIEIDVKYNVHEGFAENSRKLRDGEDSDKGNGINFWSEKLQKEHVAKELDKDLSQKIFEMTGTHLIVYKVNGETILSKNQ